MVSTGKFLLQMLQTKFASIYWISTVFDVCSGGLVDFKFGIDFPQKMNKYTESTEICFIHKGLCWKYHDLDQNIGNIENFHVMTLNGRRLSYAI